MSKPLAGKLALVTGSSRGIGAATAQRLAEEGAAVLVHYSSSKERGEAVVAGIRKAGGEAELVSGDLTSSAGVAALIKQIDPAFGGKFNGRLDILVNNAGTGAFASLADSTEEDFDRVFNLNVKVVFLLSKDAAGRMTKAGWGRIINVGSCLGEGVPFPSMALYCGTKFAVSGLTRGWSRDLGTTGITVNNIQPGPIDTELNPADGPAADSQRQKVSVGRYGKVEEVAAAVAFLAHPQSAFINGESLTVDGGWNA